MYAEELAVVGRPVEYADMGTAEGLCGQEVGNAPEGTVAAALGLGIQSVTLQALGAAEVALDQLAAVRQGFVEAQAVLAAQAALAAALAAVNVAARSLVGLAVVGIGEDIASVVVAAVFLDSIAVGVAARVVGRIAHCSEAAFDVEVENMADKAAPT